MTEDQDTGLSAPILSTPIVSTQIVSTTTVKISREDAEAMADFFTDPSERFLLGRLALACQATLEGER